MTPWDSPIIGLAAAMVIVACMIAWSYVAEAIRDLKMDREIAAEIAAEKDATENHKAGEQEQVQPTNWVFVTVMATWAIVILSGDLIASLHPWLVLFGLLGVDWDASFTWIYFYLTFTGLIALTAGMAMNNAHNHSKGDA